MKIIALVFALVCLTSAAQQQFDGSQIMVERMLQKKMNATADR